jgi:hypothetical protein
VLYHTGGAALRIVAHLAALLRPGGHLAAALSAEEAELWDTRRRRYAQRPGATLWAPLFVTVGRRDG